MHLTDAGMGEESPLWSTGKDPPREANVAGGCLNLKGIAGPQTARMLGYFFFCKKLPYTQPQALPLHGVIFPQVQNFTFPSAELHKTLGCPFLQPV